MTPFIAVELDNVMSRIAAYIWATIIHKFNYFPNRPNVIAPHSHEWLHNLYFIINFEFHIVYNMRLCLGPFLWNGLLAESSVLVIW